MEMQFFEAGKMGGDSKISLIFVSNTIKIGSGPSNTFEMTYLMAFPHAFYFNFFLVFSPPLNRNAYKVHLKRIAESYYRYFQKKGEAS